MGWYDTHAHLADETLRSQLSEVLSNATSSGLHGILCVAVDRNSSHKTIEIANENTMVKASVGIHPNYANQAVEGDWQTIEQLVHQTNVVALGETGLDLYWDDCPIEIQRDYFSRHWALSRKTGLPVIIHMRDCEKEMIEALGQEHIHGPLQGVMHSYSGSLSTALACLEMGLYISFAGMLTYKKSIELREVAKKIPLDRILLETDSPYLSPEPNRSKRPNQPAWMTYTARVLADTKNIPLSDLQRQVAENTKRLFSRWK